MPTIVRILAIESSCDETAAAVIEDGFILSNEIASQTLHSQYGGVVPELASRAHLQYIVPVVDQALKAANIHLHDLSAVAFTEGPGLIGSLLVGQSFAKSLAFTLDIPLIGVHHMQAHVAAHYVSLYKPAFPFLCVTVSGGHTQIVLVKDYLEMQIIGETRDDAAGEAFDKTAKMLGIPYPGGPIIDEYAKRGDGKRFSFPKTNIPNYDFSFSGLKTAVLYFLRDEKKKDDQFVSENLYDICASVQKTIVSILMNKLEKAAMDLGIKNIAIAGGVAANSGLRNALKDAGVKYDWNVYIPPLEYCTDNAAMIASVAYYKFLNHQFDSLDVTANARMKW